MFHQNQPCEPLTRWRCEEHVSQHEADFTARERGSTAARGREPDRRVRVERRATHDAGRSRTLRQPHPRHKLVGRGGRPRRPCRGASRRRDKRLHVHAHGEQHRIRGDFYGAVGRAARERDEVFRLIERDRRTMRRRRLEARQRDYRRQKRRDVVVRPRRRGTRRERVRDGREVRHHLRCVRRGAVRQVVRQCDRYAHSTNLSQVQHHPKQRLCFQNHLRDYMYAQGLP